MVLIFKDYNLCHFEKRNDTILKNSKPHTWYVLICGYIFVKRTSPALEAESISEELPDFIFTSFVPRRRQSILMIFIRS